MQNKYAVLSDMDLFTLVKQDDVYAYTEIYNRYKSILLIHAYSILRNEDESKDILQDLFTVIWERRQEIELKSSLSSYLYSSIKNRVLDRIAHSKIASRYLDSLEDFISKGDCITDKTIREKELRIVIEKGISGLPVKMREVFELSRMHDLTHKEIAHKLNISENTVKKQVHNALKILRLKINTLLFSLFFLFF